ncbi:hypothetical protein BH23GEM11_BH23GEM11_10660 [soil metagenome]
MWYAGLAMIAFVVAPFGAAALIQPFRQARYVRPEVILHIGLVMSWLVLFTAQSGLVHAGRIARHRKNVWLGSLLVFSSSPRRCT